MNDSSDRSPRHQVQVKVLKRRTKSLGERDFALYGHDGEDDKKVTRHYSLQLELEVPFEVLDYLLMVCKNYLYRFQQNESI